MARGVLQALSELGTPPVISLCKIAQLFLLCVCASGCKELHLTWFALQQSILLSPFCHPLCEIIFLILFVCPFLYLKFNCVFSRVQETSLNHLNALLYSLPMKFSSSSIAKVIWGKSETWTLTYVLNPNPAQHSTFLLHFHFVKLFSS